MPPQPVEFEGYRKRRIVAATKIQKMFRSWRARAQYLSNRHALALERPHGVDMRLYDPVWGRRAVEASRSHDDLGASAQALLARLRGPTGPDVAPPPQPHPAALDADAARPPAFPTDDAADDARRRALEQRIDDRVLSHRLASTVPLSSPSDMDSLDARLRRLTAERDASRGADEDLLRRRRVRLHLSRLTDALLGSAPGAPDSGGGGHGSWESLSEMPSALRAHHVPVPPEGSARMSRASQAHAMALAEITPVWWKPLARFQGLDVGAGDADTAALLGRLEAREAGRAERWEREWREVEAGWGVEELEAALRRSGVRAGG